LFIEVLPPRRVVIAQPLVRSGLKHPGDARLVFALRGWAVRFGLLRALPG
jgi:hypothetical protein